MKRKLLGFTKSILLVLLMFAALPAFSAKIYFKNTLEWTNVYVYTYSKAYWSDSNGSGSSTGQGCYGEAVQMQPVSTGSDIYQCEVSQITKYVSFTSSNAQDGYTNFWNGEAAKQVSVCYREDYSADKPLFTPETTKSGTYNQNVDYYNTGTWSAYTSKTVVGVIHWGKEGMEWPDAPITWNEEKTEGTATINFSEASTTYQFGLKTSAGSSDWFSNSSATITSTNHDNIVMNGTNGNTKITTTTAGNYTFTITYNSENQPVVSVTYPVVTYKVNIVAGAGGTVSPSGYKQVGSEGLSVTATPSDGYSFTQWNVSGGAQVSSTNSNPTTVTATADGSVTAVFTKNSGTYFLPGSWNEWKTSDESYKMTNGQKTLKLNPGTYTFKVYTDGKWYGSTSSITNTSTIVLSNAGDISMTVKEYGDYTFTVSEESGALKLTVTYPTATKKFYLTGSVTSANSFQTKDDAFSIDPTETTTITIDGNDMGRASDTNNSAFAIICDDDTDWYMRPSAGTEMTMGTPYNISSEYNSNNSYLWFNSSDKANYNYVFTIKISEGATSTATVKVQKILKKSNGVYFVSPELTGGQCLESFKMSSSRKRGGGDILPERQSFNLQDFILDAKHANKESITYWFEDAEGNKYYPSSDNYEFHDHSTTNAYAGKGTTYASYDNASTGTGTPSAKFKLTRGKAKSYTWLLDTSSNKVEYIANPSYFGNENEAGEYYLVGNFADADATVDIQPQTKEGRKLMNKYWFKDGKAYTTETADADSIVYRVTVPMPEKGWSQLYLAVFSKTDIDNWNTANLTAAWNNAIRPEEQWAYGDSGVDGTALHGGLFAMGTSRKDQAINPIVSDEYSSYTFSMNVTTSTYKLVFNSNKLYLMGPAVNNIDETGWSSTETDNTYELTYVQEEQCYKYLNDEGIEQPMKLYAGKQFAFVYNKDFTNVFYDEDNVVPVDLSGTTETNKEINAYSTAYNDTGKGDTQYVNFIKSATSNNSEYVKENVNASTFNLPTGRYTLRLYIKTDPNNAEKTEIYYLIKDRTYPFYWPDADATQMDGYTTFRSFCDYHAVVIPGGIDVFTVDTPNPKNKTVKMTPYTLSANRVLPPNTPVLLAKKDAGERTLTSYVTMEYYAEPNIINPKSTPTNLLRGQVSRYHIPVSNADNTLNFLFGYKKLQGNEKVSIGFFTPGAGNCSINTAYLTLNADFWDEVEQQNTKGFRLVFSDDNETTSVDEIQTVSDNAPAVYYNMQGVRVMNPGKGLYIRNGKKYIIR